MIGLFCFKPGQARALACLVTFVPYITATDVAAQQLYSPTATVSLSQSLRAEQLEEEEQQQEAAREAATPHAVSVAHQGNLTPVEGLEPLISGKTLYLQTPIIQNNQFLRTEIAPIYFAADGQAYSSNWAGLSWHVNGSSICITDDQAPTCMTALSDSTGQAFLLGSDNLLVQVGKIASGDSENVQQAYATEQKNEAATDTAIGSILGSLLVAGLMGGGGEGEGSSSGANSSLYQNSGTGGGDDDSTPSYTEPVGGDSGLYGADHTGD